MKMRKDLNYIIDHVFLPLRLPLEDDSNVAKDASLAEGVLAALRLFQAYIPTQERLEWILRINLVDSMLQIRNHFGGLIAEKVKIFLRGMADGGMNIPSFKE